ncbi:two-component system OmpR family response regulator [Novosphingobium sp. PhB165]|uniref:response regulator transcription factor n=1 Tax=Novosphingobium sp. PhB165 TaxID=2485105 RepID=UPI0010462659|nr:response regulator transcription factor [Novosphingobium sp. PhB165]TCM15732.1 two-component system OmpR family response regulator [Novosphingobium sp. PhB165]
MDSKRILLIDDDLELGAMLGEYLESEGFRVEVATDGHQGIRRALSGEHDAVILDIMLPRLGGIELLRQLRAANDVPVIMLSARGDEVDKVIGLELGADDYIAKPCYPRELVARLRANMRRHQPRDGRPPQAAQTLSIGGLDVQIAARKAAWRGAPVELTPSEFNILLVLVRAGNAVTTKDDLSLRGLGRARQSYDRSVDVHVSNLRIKLEGASQGEAGIETVRGVGYRIRTQ